MGETARRIGATTFQFFTRNPRGSRAKAIDPADAAALRALLTAESFGPIVAHAPYTINPCSKDERTREFARETLADDLARMEYLPGNLYNFHPGSHTGQGTDAGIAQIADTLNAILRPEQQTTVLLETMAGKGTEVGRRFEELRAIIDRVELGEKLGVCLDTCHVSDAGYDVAGNLDGVLAEFDRVIGLARLRAVHLNDSLNPCGAHKDRHARIGEGTLGQETFRRIINHPALRNLPFVLETPNELRWLRARDCASARDAGGGRMMLQYSALAIFLLGAAGLADHSMLLKTGHIRPGFFCFYTNLSNIWILLYQILLFFAGFSPEGALWRVLHGRARLDGYDAEHLGDAPDVPLRARTGRKEARQTLLRLRRELRQPLRPLYHARARAGAVAFPAG